jgi:hypothetical protein
MDDIFDDGPLDTHGRLVRPNSRGNANQETTGLDFDDSLDDDFGYEGMPPGPGAAAATDLSTDSFDYGDEDEDDVVPQDTPGMVQTTYGAHSWGIDNSRGHRPESMMTSDRNMNSMGGDDIPVSNPPRNPQANRAGSNYDVDPETLDDQADDEGDDSHVYGHGIFGGEASTTWRPSYGSFAHQYALPDYIGKEDEMAVQGSAMWDVTRGAWRIVQPSASGVALSRIVPGSPNGQPNAYSPFATTPPMAQVGPASRSIERFGHEVATTIARGAATLPAEQRGAFISNAIEALGPGLALRADRTAKRLVSLGHPKEVALHDTLAHLVMHTTSGDLRKAIEQTKQGRRPVQGTIPSISRLTARTGPAVGGHIKKLRAELLAKAESSPEEASGELGSFYASRAKGQIGYLGLAGGPNDLPEAPTVAAQPAVSQPPSNSAPLLTGAPADAGLLRPRNLIIGAVVLGSALYAYKANIFGATGSSKDSGEIVKNAKGGVPFVFPVRPGKSSKKRAKARRTSRSKR